MEIGVFKVSIENYTTHIASDFPTHGNTPLILGCLVMNDELLLVKQTESIELERNTNRGLEKKTNIKFREILCPMSAKPLKASLCSRCEYKKTFLRKHESGITLETMICIFGQD